MPRSPAVLSLVFPSILLAAACSEPPPSGTEPHAAKGGLGDDGCPTWGCTSNSPVMGPYAFHELNFNGLANAEGVSVSSIQRGATWYRAEIVDGSHLVADEIGSGTRLSGLDLQGLIFHLQTPTGPYELIIQQVTPAAGSPVALWVGTQDPVETYELVYNDPAQPRIIPLCANPPFHEWDDGGAQPWGNPIESILFTGDRYDPYLKTVTHSTYGEARDWFNIGCARSALAKLFLTGNTTASATPLIQPVPPAPPAPPPPPTAQRQAMLKMFAGDMCGTGQPFTVAGTPLHWEVRDGSWTFTDTEIGFESFWDEDGAQCVTEHRLGPDLLAEVLAACALGPCPGSPGFPTTPWSSTALVKTAIPAP